MIYIIFANKKLTMRKKIIYSTLGLCTMLFYACGDKEPVKSIEDEAIAKKTIALKEQAYHDSIQEVIRVKNEELKAQEDLLRREEIVELAKLERNFPPYCQIVVAVEKSYFYNGPDKNKISRKYLISGDECTIIKTQKGFGYAEYYNSYNDKTSTGWLDLHDLENIDNVGGD